MEIGITDKNGVSIKEGNKVRVTTLNHFQEPITIAEGEIRYMADEIASYGCGFAVVGENTVLLSTIARTGTEIEIIK